ncbi:hypothetical protein [Membranihabitans marinus]|uniref:hypothetical protein n=1 Tax=Membranihabitans marinus TaxID=1227546 RepID=UPI001F178EE8|nr:hypothetical protein [Membranihabitans marinus]
MKKIPTIKLVLEPSNAFPSRYTIRNTIDQLDRGLHEYPTSLVYAGNTILNGLNSFELSEPNRVDYRHNGVWKFLESNSFNGNQIFTGLLRSRLYYRLYMGDWKDKTGNKSTIGLRSYKETSNVRLVVLHGYCPRSVEKREVAIYNALMKR